ncbi:alpha-amylase family protein [Litchfieldia salsa]|uniref:Beta-galactosidase trimerisation domain-containing protein n=1 Tax=Litchfieldia salsa TaxID=930152 RepID=A0A1H0VMU4_9BACI|nr:beta-galactosidase [Litchfieldia salsa]SDP79535.1 Beta-galactosidase trimerisation domain-containing protein [Litchfieldia salsa]
MNKWWDGYSWRMIQTNFREIDMENIDAVSYAKDLKEFGATLVLLNAAGITASYDSNLPFQPNSEYLNGDSLNKIIEECHKQGIKVIARTDFSKIQYSVYEKNPDWAYRTREGKIVNYNGYVHTCLNGGYQQEYMFEILQEVLTTHEFDGLFCNMSGFLVVDYSYKYHGPCHCENCQRKFKEQYGLELPEKDDPRSSVYKKYMIFKKDCEKEHTERLRRLVKDISPDIAINGLDYIRGESNTDIGRANWQYSASSNSRVISGPDRNRPTDNASVGFMGFRYRHTSVSPALMELRQWQNLANAGSLSMYIMGRLDNHLDTSGLEATKKVFQFHQKHEKLYSNLVSMAKGVVVRNASLYQSDSEVFGWIRALTESHIPFDEIRISELNDLSQLDGKEFVVLGDIKFLSDQQVKLFDDFAANGGTVIATGETGLFNNHFEARNGMALNCLGIEHVKENKSDLLSSIFKISEAEKDLFPRCNNTPLIAPGPNLVLVEPKENAKKYLQLIPEHPFGPPEICYYNEVIQEPGIIMSEYHKGRGVYIPWKIGSFYREQGYQNTLNIMQDILFSLCGIEEIAPNLTPMVEVNMVKDKDNDKQMIQFVNNSGCFANSYFSPVPIHNISLRLKDVKESAQIETLRGGKVEYRFEDGYLNINLDVLKDYDAIVLS